MDPLCQKVGAATLGTAGAGNVSRSRRTLRSGAVSIGRMTDAATDPTPAQAVPPPEGFRAARMGGPFVALAGPLFARLESRTDGVQLLMGFRVEQRHCNPLGMCHGGMLATFADMLMPMAAMYQAAGERRFLPTISLQMDYLAPAMLGAWVQGEAQILRTTRNLLFAQGLVSADGAPALRVSGVFKQGQLIGDGTDRDPLKLQNQ